MKTDSSARAMTSGTPGDAFQAFFELTDQPAALCDPSWNVRAANPAFAALAGTVALEGRKLSEVIAKLPAAPPEEGLRIEVEAQALDGQALLLSLVRRGETVAVVVKATPNSVRGTPEQQRFESKLLELGRNVAGAASEEELVATVARGVKGLFPRRTFCVRITDPRTLQLTSLYAEGRLKERATDVIVLKATAVEKTHLDVRGLPGEKVKVVTGGQDVPLVFHGSVRALAAPLVASGQLFGAVNVEYPEGLSADVAADERALIQLANQVAVAVRNAKLIDELTFVRKYLEELLEHANALILVADRDRRIVVFNRAMTELTRFDKSEVLGQDLMDFIAEGEKMKLMRVVAQSLKGEGVASFETRILDKKKHEVRVAFATSAVLSQGGEIEGVIAIGQDMTRMRDLERRVIQAEKLASIGQLAASVVHEINNPMTAVVTYADALLQRARTHPPKDPGDAEKYKKIVDNSERVLRFTRDLVSYARPATDKPETVELNQVFEKAVDFCEVVLDKHDVQLERSFGPVPRMLAVKQNLVQVFVNLITNACHAVGKGGKITLATRAEANAIVAEVSDSGVGIDENVIDHIFEPFFTTKGEGKGTGLGLSIVQGIVENHGGTISVQSTAGKGTTFTLRFPIVMVGG